MNVAFGKSTDQSSTNNYNSTVRGISSNAVDGNPDTDFGSGHCSRTNAADPSWWRVDLGGNLVAVSEVYIVNSYEQQGNKDYNITFGEYITIYYCNMYLELILVVVALLQIISSLLWNLDFIILDLTIFSS